MLRTAFAVFLASCLPCCALSWRPPPPSALLPPRLRRCDEAATTATTTAAATTTATSLPNRLASVILSSFSLGLVELCVVPSSPALAVAPAPYNELNLGEQIRKGASVIPGLGKPDVYYPRIYEGSWKCEQEVTAIVDNTEAGVEAVDAELLKRYRAITGSGAVKPSFSYSRVFSNYGDNVILDRGVSTANLYSALSSQSTSQPQTKWIAAFDPSNDNNLKLSSSSGQILDTKVTKRSVEDVAGKVVNGDNLVAVSVPRKEDAVGYSEFVRIVEEDPSTNANLPPSTRVYGTRLLARYKAKSDDEIAGIERLYFYSAEGERDEKPFAIVKSRVTLTRENK